MIYVLSGPMAAGKTTVARLLAERFDRGVHLEGDVFRRFVVSGRVEMTPDAAAEALAQLELRYRIAASAASAYAEGGFTAVVEDVIAGPHLPVFATALPGAEVIVLLPSIEAIRSREASRAESGYGAWSVERLYRVFADETPRIGRWLDTSDLTPPDTVEEILTGAPSS